MRSQQHLGNRKLKKACSQHAQQGEKKGENTTYSNQGAIKDQLLADQKPLRWFASILY